MTHKEFAEVRRSINKSQGQVALRAGVTQSFVSQFERGYVRPRPELLNKMVTALRQELVESAQESLALARKLAI